jgi:hypothetical protein
MRKQDGITKATQRNVPFKYSTNTQKKIKKTKLKLHNIVNNQKAETIHN